MHSPFGDIGMLFVFIAINEYLDFLKYFTEGIIDISLMGVTQLHRNYAGEFIVITHNA